jgi:hypothetical protein
VLAILGGIGMVWCLLRLYLQDPPYHAWILEQKYISFKSPDNILYVDKPGGINPRQCSVIFLGAHMNPRINSKIQPIRFKRNDQ